MYQWFFAAVVPEGGRAFLVADSPCLQLTFFPPSPSPPSRREGGGNQGYFMQGASPLASPRLSRRRHGLNLRCRCPVGGLPSLPPAMLFCPHPPDPLPGGKGETKSLFRRGLRPRHPSTEPSTALTAPATQAPLWGGGLFLAQIPAAPAGANAPFEAERTGFPQAKPVPRPAQPLGMQGAKPLA